MSTDESLISSLDRALRDNASGLSESLSPLIADDLAGSRGASPRPANVTSDDQGVRRDLRQRFAALDAPELRTEDAESRLGSRSPPERLSTVVSAARESNVTSRVGQLPLGDAERTSVAPALSNAPVLRTDVSRGTPEPMPIAAAPVAHAPTAMSPMPHAPATPVHFPTVSVRPQDLAIAEQRHFELAQALEVSQQRIRQYETAWANTQHQIADLQQVVQMIQGQAEADRQNYNADRQTFEQQRAQHGIELASVRAEAEQLLAAADARAKHAAEAASVQTAQQQASTELVMRTALEEHVAQASAQIQALTQSYGDQTKALQEQIKVLSESLQQTNAALADAQAQARAQEARANQLSGALRQAQARDAVPQVHPVQPAPLLAVQPAPNADLLLRESVSLPQSIHAELRESVSLDENAGEAAKKKMETAGGHQMPRTPGGHQMQ